MFAAVVFAAFSIREGVVDFNGNLLSVSFHFKQKIFARENCTFLKWHGVSLFSSLLGASNSVWYNHCSSMVSPKTTLYVCLTTFFVFFPICFSVDFNSFLALIYCPRSPFPISKFVYAFEGLSWFWLLVQWHTIIILCGFLIVITFILCVIIPFGNQNTVAVP